MSAPTSKPRFASLRAFAYPAYVRMWLGAFMSNVGTWVQTIAVGVYVTETTGKAGWTGTIAALSYVPAVALGPIGGALADRWDRRRLIAALTVIQAVCAGGLAALGFSGRLSLAAIGVLVFVSGCASALSMPAFGALLSELVEPEDLLSAVSLNSGQFNLARTLGPMLAAGVLTVGGTSFAFAANALSYVAILLALASVAAIARPIAPRRESLWQGVATGVRVAREDPGIRLALPMVLAVTVLVAPFIGLMPAYAIKGFDRGAAGASMLATSQGLGALVAAFTANAFAMRWGARNLLVRSLLLLAPLAACYWLVPRFWLALAVVAVMGGVYLWTLTSLSTLCMGRVSRDIQARMASLYSMALSGGYAFGLVAQGWLSDRLGLRAVPALAAGVMLALVVFLRQRGSFEAVDAPRPFGARISEPPAQPGIAGSSGDVD